MSNLQKAIPSHQEIKAELCRRSFYYFVQTFWSAVIPESPIWNWHMEYLCNELQIVAERVVRREAKLYDLVINVPPGTSKSTICTIMLPAWIWILDPTIKTMTASYSGGLSGDHSVKTRDIIKSSLFQLLFPHVQIRRDIDGKTHYQNTAGGERYATSVRGTATGKHAHLLIVDDPLDPRGADSDADRKTANDFMDKTLSTRKIDKSNTPTILVMQRLHRNDCTGNWLEKRTNIKHICLPAEISKNIQPPELVEYYVNGLLDNFRLNKEQLNDLKQSLGSYGYAGQMMQTPSPDDGGIWKKWLIAIEDEDLDRLKLEKLGTDWDLAYTKNERNSASAFITAGKHGSNMYITDAGFEWLEFPKLIEFMQSQVAPHYIEAKASGKSAKQTLNNNGVAASEVSVTGGDKIARAVMASPYAESGMVYCRRSLLDMIYNDVRQGILQFPNNDADDLQDALVQAINRLCSKKTNTIRGSYVS